MIDYKSVAGKLEPSLRDVIRVVTSEVKANSSDAKPLTVETIDNHIYFYSAVNTDRTLALIREIRGVDAKLRSEQLSRNIETSTPIWLHVQSGGGGLFAGLAMADQLAHIASPVYSIVEGYCASAATLISMACTKRFIHPSAFMLIHQLSADAWGKYEELVDEMHLLGMAMERLNTFYQRYTRLDEEQIKKYLERDSWFNAEECLELGFVDEISS